MPDMPEPDQKRAVAPAVARPSRQSLVVPQPQSNLPLVIGAFGSVLGAAAGFWMIAAALAGGGVSAWRRLQVEPRGPRHAR